MFLLYISIAPLVRFPTMSLKIHPMHRGYHLTCEKRNYQDRKFIRLVCFHIPQYYNIKLADLQSADMPLFFLLNSWSLIVY